MTNEITIFQQIQKSNIILDELNKKRIYNLNKFGKESEQYKRSVYYYNLNKKRLEMYNSIISIEDYIKYTNLTEQELKERRDNKIDEIDTKIQELSNRIYAINDNIDKKNKFLNGDKHLQHEFKKYYNKSINDIYRIRNEISNLKDKKIEILSLKDEDFRNLIIPEYLKHAYEPIYINAFEPLTQEEESLSQIANNYSKATKFIELIEAEEMTEFNKEITESITLCKDFTGEFKNQINLSNLNRNDIKKLVNKINNTLNKISDLINEIKIIVDISKDIDKIKINDEKLYFDLIEGEKNNYSRRLYISFMKDYDEFYKLNNMKFKVFYRNDLNELYKKLIYIQNTIINEIKRYYENKIICINKEINFYIKYNDNYNCYKTLQSNASHKLSHLQLIEDKLKKLKKTLLELDETLAIKEKIRDKSKDKKIKEINEVLDINYEGDLSIKTIDDIQNTLIKKEKNELIKSLDSKAKNRSKTYKKLKKTN